ncbi:MAG: iron ABC transporter permease [bacterium]|nr:iron ABC transporter permease [bacterium]MBU1917186.1 iron ABC transporter permease [bacterium]
MIKKSLIISLALIFAIFLLSFLGDPIISPRALFDKAMELDRNIYLNFRLPRVLLAIMIGAALSVSGVSFQALLKNPLADPYILGVSGGAALGYVLGVVLGFPFFLVPIMGFAFALGTLFCLYKLACRRGVLSVLNLLLIGIVFNAFSFALILVINSLANFGQAQQILYLLLGSIDPLGWDKLIILSVFILGAFVILFFQAKKLNILSLGDEEAYHLGLNVNREKKIIFVITSLLVGASVSVCGLIGFIGLIVPHLTRLIFGADNRIVLPMSALIGGLLLMSCDFIAGNIFSFEVLNTRLPVGAVTALIGAPLFVVLLKRT